MMQKKQRTYIYVIPFLVCFINSYGTTYDNRYFPLFSKNHIWYDSTQSQIQGRLFFSTAQEVYFNHSEVSESKSSEYIPIPELFGSLDLKNVGYALSIIGKNNPLPPAWQEESIQYTTDGKIQMQSFFIETNHHIYGLLSTGFSGGIMNMQASHRYRYLKGDLVVNGFDLVALEKNRGEMFDLLGVNGGAVTQIGFSDIDWFVRLGRRFDYMLKLKSMNIGGRVGLLFPSGYVKDLDKAGSVPFGAEGHWGIYASFDGMFELKEDMKVGFLLRVNKRLSRTRQVRLSVSKEPELIGAIRGPVRINPGFTAIVAPYFLLENVRKGLGFLFQYTGRIHQKDSWHDMRADKTIPVDLISPVSRSSWSSDYFSLELFYDIGKERIVRDCEPVFFARWDIPYKAIGSEKSVKTHQLSCGVSCVF